MLLFSFLGFKGKEKLTWHVVVSMDLNTLDLSLDLVKKRME